LQPVHVNPLIIPIYAIVHCDYSPFLLKAQRVDFVSWMSNNAYHRRKPNATFTTHRRNTMKATKFIAAVAVFVAAGSAFAADTPAANAAATAAAAAANSSIAVVSLNVPAVTISMNNSRTRTEVHAEAVQALKNYKSTLAVQLDQYKN
jgi:hypothetical protein